MPKVRKTEKGLALKRWFKEKWRTPRGKTEHLDLQERFHQKLLQLGLS